MYEPYPSAGQNGQTVEPGQRPPVPPSVQTAVRLMYAGAAISAITFILGLTSLGNLKHAIRTQHPHYTNSQVNTAVNSSIALIVIVGLIGIGLWVWMAWANKRGKNWARITGTVLFALYTLDMILALSVQSAAAASLVGSFVLWLIGLGTVIMLWRRESSEFFKRPLY
ncbi:MAG TPA: hypothetical protein VE733_03930 [Streptosporangiaceae bacterium]|jgi:hypothetical protein|nr:hypothetical protein [Streptosporangiaceae bacterium]